MGSEGAIFRAITFVEAVESTLVFGKVVPFAGHCWNEGLGRSVTVRKGSLPQTNGRADDSRVFFGRRGGERRQRNVKSVRTRRERWSHQTRFQGTRPSLGPKARARQSSLHFGRRKSNEGGAVLGASRLGKPTEVGGTNTGVTGIGRRMRGSPRTTGSLGNAAWCGKEKEGG